MDETLVGDMHTLPHFARDRHFPIILSLIKYAGKGQITQSGKKGYVELGRQREEE